MSAPRTDHAGRVCGRCCGGPRGETREGLSRGVLLASGGFEHNQQMRGKFLPSPTSRDWAVGAVGNTGDSIQAAAKLGAKLALMDKVWGGPIAITPDGKQSFILAERSYPSASSSTLTGRGL
ncbi:MAG: FAD-binding protein [Candidatus Caldarchaeum sp.]